MNQKRANRLFLYAQFIIVIMIAICLLILMRFSDTKLNELITSDREGLFIEVGEDSSLEEQLQDIILEFRPGAYKMIEVYSEDYNPMLRLQFLEDGNNINDPITNHPNLIEFLNTHNNGYTSFIVDEKEQHIYFKWTETSDAKRCLFIIYTSFPVVNNLWIFHVLCYTILVLVFLLIIILSFRNHNDKINEYRNNSNNMREELIVNK